MKYYLYARKSTDEDDRQVLSIEAQLTELREYASKEKLEVIDEFIESKTAKVPGRPIFNKMIEQVELGGHPDNNVGILAWHPDRLARNSIDGGKIIYLIDEQKIESLKFPTFWFDSTPQGKFMLSIAFGQSKYYIDNLSENIKRGIRQKLRRGELPGLAPVGYLNELRHHTIVKDPERWKAVRTLFEAYATGEKTLEDLQKLSLSLGLVSRRTDKALSLSRLDGMLQNPFYYSVITRKGEAYQGSHEPIISKQLFDKVQREMQKRSKPRKAKEIAAFAFRGIFTCGECGRAITAEKKVKKSGRTYIYYRCTKKNRVCSQKYVEERELVKQLNELFQKVALSDDWKEKFMKQWELDYKKASTASSSSAGESKMELKVLEEKQMRLLDAYLEQTITNEEYTETKKKLLNRKIEIKENLKESGGRGLYWLELFKEWILSAHQAINYVDSGNLEEKRSFLQKIGSNFYIIGQKAAVELGFPWAQTAKISQYSVWST
ncbi:MAG: recombinase family protein [Candidatus Peregrinibacteria bacterium]|nr:recombinase family protein [Candidatus Peregrinibacteria bacterium]MDZ4244449.1 recombinase family protein [Candidatus Gracilibacteria bacterium]